MQRMDLVKKTVDYITKVIEYILLALFIVMVAVIFGQVVTRYLFHKSLHWAEELGIYTMIWSCFLGTAIAVRKKAHTRMGFFVGLLSVKKQIIMEIFVNLLCMAWMCVITNYAFKVTAIGLRNISTGLKIPLGYIYFSLPLSGIIMIFYFIVLSIEQVLNYREIRKEDTKK